MTPSSDTNESDFVDLGPTQPLRATLRGLASIVAPTTLVTALLYYFGWVRTAYQTHALGLDESLLGYSTPDYVLRSISPMYWPLFFGVLGTLGGLLLHTAIVSWATPPLAANAPTARPRLRLLRILTAALAAAGCVLLALGVVGAHVREPSRFVSFSAPLSVTVSIALLGYAAHVWRRFVKPHRIEGRLAAELRGVALLASSLVIALLFLSVFWTVSHYASRRGIDFAAEAERRLPAQPSVTLYSAKRLDLLAPIEETQLAGEDRAYRYVYTGLKLLFRSEHKYFLRPSDTADTRNIVIPESPDLRLEFARGG